MAATRLAAWGGPRAVAAAAPAASSTRTSTLGAFGSSVTYLPSTPPNPPEPPASSSRKTTLSAFGSPVTYIASTPANNCTTGSVDIVIDPTLVTVADATGFSVGDTIVFSNAVGTGQDLTTTITGISGNEITLEDPASATVSDEQFCLVSAGGGGGWFGPQGDCGCGCAGCTCEDSVDHFAESLLTLSNCAVAATWDSSYDIENACLGMPSTSTTYSFPGFAGGTIAIDSANGCVFGVSQTDTPPLNPGWYEGVAGGPYGTCGIREAIHYSEFQGLPSFQAPNVVGRITYAVDESCGHLRTLYVAARYTTASWYFIGWDAYGTVAPDMDAAWTLAEIRFAPAPGGTQLARWTYTSGNVTWQLKMEVTSLRPQAAPAIAYLIELSAWTTDDTIDTIALQDAPAYYDPYGLLLGRVTIS